MDQATATTTVTTPRTDGTFAHAHAVAGIVVAELSADQLPFAVEIEEGFPSGYRVHLKFRETRAAGLLAFAALVDVPVTRAETPFGVHLDAITRIEDVEIRGSALVSAAQAALLQGEAAPLNTSNLDTEDAARCVRCGCTEERACKGGCYWVPNRQMIDLCSACATPDELQAMTSTAEISDGAE